MSGILQGLLASVAGTSGPPEFDYVASTFAQESTSSRTFSAFNIGAADSQRRVVVFVNFYANSAGTSLSSVTVAGQSTSIAATVTNGRSVAAICITEGPVASGTTADIVVTASAGFFEIGISTYRAINLKSTTPTDTDSATASGATRSVSVLKDGCIFGNGGQRGFFGEFGDITWTNLTRNYFIDGYESLGIGYRTSGALYVATGGDTNRSVTCNMADEFEPVVCYASFR